MEIPQIVVLVFRDRGDLSFLLRMKLNPFSSPAARRISSRSDFTHWKWIYSGQRTDLTEKKTLLSSDKSVFFSGGDGGARKSGIVVPPCLRSHAARGGLATIFRGGQTRHWRVCLSALRAPLNKIKTKSRPVWSAFCFGGDGGARTPDLFDVSEAL